MLSRVADSIYWMARHVERAENIARFIDVNLSMMLDLPEGQWAQWEPLVSTTGDAELFTARYGEATRENVLEFLTFDGDYANSVLSCLRAARENARSIREAISEEMWEGINGAYLMVNEAARRPDALATPHDFFAQIKANCHQFIGASLTTMAHGEGWLFSRLGFMIERADKTSRVLDVKYFYPLPGGADAGSPIDDVQWSAVLRSVSGLSAYRQRRPRIQPSWIVEFLILDCEFPRAMRHCLIAAEESLRALTGSRPGTFQNSAERLLGRLRSELDYTQAEEIIRGGLHEYIDSFQTKLNAVGEAIRESCLDAKPTPLLAGAIQEQ